MRKEILNITKRMLLDKNYIWAIRQAYKWGAIKLASTLKLPPLTGPMMGGIVVTYRCNSRCKMCDLWKRAALDKRAELATEEYLYLIDEFAKLGTSGIGFTGGEPLLRDDIYQLIHYARKKGMIVTISTNGLQLSNIEVARKLIDSSPHNINISLDSADESNYDWLRGTKGGFKSTIEGIRNVVSYKTEKRLKSPQIAVVTVLSRKNLYELEAIISLCENIGVENIGFIPIQNSFEDDSNRAWDNLCFKNGNDDIGKTIDKLNRWRRNKKGIQIDNSKRYIQMFPLAFSASPCPVKCIAGYGSLYVDAYGDVYPCLDWVEKKKAVNNIRSHSIINIWGSTEYRTLRRNLCFCRDCFWNCQTELSLMFDLFSKIDK